MFNMNILQMEDAIKGFPDDRLAQEAQNPNGTFPQFLLLSEAQRRTKMRQQYAADQAEMPQGTIKDQTLQAFQSPPQAQSAQPQAQPGVGAPPMQPSSPQPPGMASGGLVQFARGGQIPGSRAVVRNGQIVYPEEMELESGLAKLMAGGDTPADTAMTPRGTSFRPESNKRGMDTQAAYQDVSVQQPVTPWQYNYAGNPLPGKEGLGEILSGAGETWKSMAEEYFVGGRDREPVRASSAAVVAQPPAEPRMGDRPSPGNMYNQAAEARRQAHANDEVYTLDKLKRMSDSGELQANLAQAGTDAWTGFSDLVGSAVEGGKSAVGAAKKGLDSLMNADYEGIGLSIAETGREAFGGGHYDPLFGFAERPLSLFNLKNGPVAEGFRNSPANVTLDDASNWLGDLGDSFKHAFGMETGEDMEANAEENAAKTAAGPTKGDGESLVPTKGTEVVMADPKGLDAILSDGGFDYSSMGGISPYDRLKNAELEYEDLVADAQGSSLDLSESIKQGRDAAWGTYLMNLGAGIASNDMGEGMALGARSMAEGMQDVRRMQMAQEQSKLDAGQAGRQLTLAGRTTEYTKEKELAEMALREKEKALDRTLTKYGLDIRAQEQANYLARNDETERGNTIRALGDYITRLESSLINYDEDSEEAKRISQTILAATEQLGKLATGSMLSSDQLPTG